MWAIFAFLVIRNDGAIGVSDDETRSKKKPSGLRYMAGWLLQSLHS